MTFKLGREKRRFRTPSDTPIFRKKLGDGILGEANKDGSIFIDKNVVPGSEQEKHILIHEMVHLTDMKVGKIRHEGQHAKDMKSGMLDYGNDHVRFKGKTYHRKKGKIKYNGKWYKEGSDIFPWEKRAKKVE